MPAGQEISASGLIVGDLEADMTDGYVTVREHDAHGEHVMMTRDEARGLRDWLISMLPPGIPCSERMPTPREYVLMWETPSLRWSVGCWFPEYSKWGNRDDKEYAIHLHQVSHWMPLPEPIR